MKKILAAVLMLALCISCFAFVGCDNGKSGNKGAYELSENATYNGEEVEITFYNTKGCK